MIDLNLLGLCARSRNLVTGDLVLSNIKNQKAKLVIIANDASDNTKKKYMDKCTFYNIKYTFIESSENLSKAIGQNNRMVCAILDEGFANKMIK